MFVGTFYASWYMGATYAQVGDNVMMRRRMMMIMMKMRRIMMMCMKTPNRRTKPIICCIYTPPQLTSYCILFPPSLFTHTYTYTYIHMQAVTLAFTAASNNFELALAVAVGTFGLNSGQALMSVVGALIEIPTMLSLVKIAFYFRTHLYHEKVGG